MDKILYRNSSKSEVIGRCGGNEKNRMTTQNRQKSNAKKDFRIQNSQKLPDVFFSETIKPAYMKLLHT